MFMHCTLSVMVFTGISKVLQVVCKVGVQTSTVVNSDITEQFIVVAWYRGAVP